MEIFYGILVLLLIIGVSNIINHFLPFIPVPLFQVALGVILAVFSPTLNISLEPELFFVLFVAPLLFNDGKHVPRDELWNLRAPILLLALGLVFTTVFVVGYIINWMIPSIPLPAAFALAAILSPTDAVAVGALAGRINLPKNIKHLLEGEALMNDASGLVAFKFAIAATVTGVFSLHEATISFFIIALGGILSGALIAFLIIRFRVFLRHLGMEDVTMHMLIQILTPFVIFLIAEHFGFSGILAVVAGGIVHAIEKDATESVDLKMQVVSSSTWSVILFILNGLVFIILGLQIPDVVNVIFKDEAFNNYQVIGYIVMISISLYVLRFLWIVIFSEGVWILKKSKKRNKSSLKAYILTSISGVRGTVTLAGAFSIPLVLRDGTAFPGRDLIIFISAGVILFTLITASVFLPIFSDKRVPTAVNNEDKEKVAKIKLIRYVIYTLKMEMNEENREAVLSVVSDYRHILKSFNRGKTKNRLNTSSQSEIQIHLIGIKAEQQEIQSLLERGKIDIEVAYKMKNILNHTEMLLSNRFKMRVVSFILSNVAKTKYFAQKLSSKKCSSRRIFDLGGLREIRTHTLNVAIEAIRNQINDENRESSLSVITHYDEIIQKFRYSLKDRKDDVHYEKLKKEIQLKALQVARDRVQLLYKDGAITFETASKLRQFINQNEALTLEQENLADAFNL